MTKSRKERRELPELKGAKVSRVDDGRVAIEVDGSVVAGLVIAGLNLTQESDLDAAAVVIAMVEAAWVLLDVTTGHPIEKRREMMLSLINGMTEADSEAVKGTIQ